MRSVLLLRSTGAAAEMCCARLALVKETVQHIDLDVRWEPNCPDARLVVADDGNATLSLNPHADDADTRRLVLSWSDCVHAQMGAPNDEARHLHHLGLTPLSGLWLGEVLASELVAALGPMTAQGTAGLRHYVLPLKESMVEVVARTGPSIARRRE